jgi:hypothetical protein
VLVLWTESCVPGGAHQNINTKGCVHVVNSSPGAGRMGLFDSGRLGM